MDSALERLGSLPALSIITRIELEGGVVAKPHLFAKRRRSLDVLLGILPILDFDASCADAYRGMVETVGFSRRKTNDRMIAATALVHRLTVITANPGDFRDVPGLALEVWP